VIGEPKVKAQFELTYANGSTQTISTDESWLARSGPTVFSSWWGGEDYDGSIMRTGWTEASNALSGDAWHKASIVELDDETIPRADTPLVADPRPPVTVAERVEAVSITEKDPAPAEDSSRRARPGGHAPQQGPARRSASQSTTPQPSRPTSHRPRASVGPRESCSSAKSKNARL
jgi:hypothetical protein